MRLYWLTVVMLLLIPTMLYAQSSPLPKDPNLDKPVTLAVKGEELSDIAASLAKQTGAKLRIHKDIPRMKVTIFVDKQPLRDVMMGLETLFRFRWSVVKKDNVDCYELWDTLKAREERLAGWEKTYADAWNRQDSKFRNLAEFAAKSPNELLAIKKRIDEKAEQATQPGSVLILTPEESKARYAIMGSYYDPDQAFVPNADLVLFYNRFSPDILNALKSGCTVCFDSASPEPQWRIPDDITMRFNNSYNGKDDSRYGVRFFTKRTGSKLSMHVNMQAMNSRLGGMKTVIEDGINITEQAIPDYLPHDKFPEMFTKAFGIKREELSQETGINPATVDNIPYANKSDLLALIHKKTGAQIIADHYSFWTFADLSSEYAATDWIYNSSFPQRYCGWDSKFFYVRTAASQGIDAAEIPNYLIRRWQDILANQGYLGMQELAEIATSLSDEQIETLKRNTVFYKLAESSAKPGNIGIWRNYDTGDPKISALRLYYKLNVKQRQQALSGGISTRGFNAPQRAALAEYLTIIDLPNTSTVGGLNYPVGIYKNGIRIDKPGPASLLDTITVSLEAPTPYVFITSNERMGLQGKTVDEAWKFLQQQYASMGRSKTSIPRGLLYPSLGVEFVLRFADGGMNKTPIKVLGKPILPPGTK
ncbi:MAG: hypothetical protein ACYC27_21975 [Armatimonadota bacterium]